MAQMITVYNKLTGETRVVPAVQTRPSAPASEAPTGSRVIYDDSGRQAQVRVTTYPSGKIVYKDLQSGESEEYQGPAGVAPKDVSIPEKDIMPQQRPAAQAPKQSVQPMISPWQPGYSEKLGTSQISGEVISSSGEVTKIQPMPKPTPKPAVAPIKSYIPQQTGVSTMQGYILPSGEKTTSKQRAIESITPEGMTDMPPPKSKIRTDLENLGRWYFSSGKAPFQVYDPETKKWKESYTNPITGEEVMQRTASTMLVPNLFGSVAKTGVAAGIRSYIPRVAAAFGSQEGITKLGEVRTSENNIEFAKYGINPRELRTEILSQKQTEIDKSAYGFNIPVVNWKVSPVGMVYSAPGGFILTKREEQISEALRKRGVPEERLPDLTKAIKSQFRYQAAGEAVGAVVLESAAEGFARPVIAKSFQKAAGTSFTKSGSIWALTKRTVPASTAAGFGEGFFGDVMIRRSRGEQQDFGESVKSGYIGAGTASLFQFGTSGLRVAAPRVSKVTNIFGQAIDFPYELGGDVTQNIIESAQMRTLGRRYVRPVVLTPSTTKKGAEGPFTITTTEDQRPQLFGKRSIPILTDTGKSKSTTVGYRPGIPVTIADTKQPDFTIDITPEPTRPKPIITPTKVPTDTDEIISDYNDFIDNRQDNIQNIFNIVTDNTKTDTSTTTRTSVPSIMNMPVPVSVITPSPRWLPPLPFAFPTSGTQKVSRGKGPKIFLDELSVGKGLLAGLLGGAEFPAFTKKKLKKTKRKKK